MANTTHVAFKKGLQSAIPQDKGAIAGAFYLTTDTNKLYIGNDNGQAVLLNSGIKTLKDMAALRSLVEKSPEAMFKEDLYYLIDDNVLCAYNEAQAQWIQINPDNNDFAETSGFKIERSAADDDQSKGKAFKWTLAQTNHGKASATAELTGVFYISPSDVAELNKVSVGLKAEAGTGLVKIVPDGAGSNTNAAVVLKQGTNTTITKDESGNVIIDAKGKEYTFNKGVLTTASVSGTSVTINHDNVSCNKATPAAVSLKAGDSIKTISDVTISQQGHITGYSENSYTLPKDKYATYAITALNADAEGKLTATLTGAGDDAEAHIFTSPTQDLYYTIGENTVYNQGDLASYICTKEDLEKQLKGLNPMRYQGIAQGWGGLLAIKPVSIGDTYLSNTNFSIPKDFSSNGRIIEVKPKDLLIAQAAVGTTENPETGILAPENVRWTHVPSADTTDTTYDLSANGNKITLVPSVGDSDIITLVSGADKKIEAISANNQITFSHSGSKIQGTAEAEETLSSGGSFNVLTSLESDGTSHIKAFKTKKFTLPTIVNTNYGLTSPAGSASIKLKKDNIDYQQVTLKGDIDGSIAVSGTIENEISIKHGNTLTQQINKVAALSSPKGGESITMVSSFDVDSYGHTTSAKFNQITLPNFILKTANGSGLSLTESTADNEVTYTIGLEWDTF